MMKRWVAMGIAFCLCLSICAVAEQSSEKTVDLRGEGIVIMRNKEIIEGDKQKQAIDYPTFEGEDQALADYLLQVVTEPFLALRKLGQMKEDEAYAEGNKDFIRSGYFASLDFSGLLSVEMTVTNRAAGEVEQEALFLYRIIDLNHKKELTLYDLFDTTEAAVDEAIANAVYEICQADGSIGGTIESPEQISAADSYFVMKEALRCIFAEGTINAEAAVVDIPWEQLGLPQSSILTGTSGSQEVASLPVEEEAVTLTSLEAILECLMSGDWQYGDAPSYLRFMDDGVLVNPIGGGLEFDEYYIDEGQLVLVQPDGEEYRAEVAKVGENLRFTFEEAGDRNALTLRPSTETMVSLTSNEGEANTQPLTAEPLVAAPRPDFELPPVTTATPMPISGSDVPIVDLLVRGLWKQMGTDNTKYYQFTADGKLLIVNVEDYTVVDGYLQSESLSGEVIPGGDTAFTLNADGQLVGYVLNRSGVEISGAEFVTPTPTPIPTPTPTPTPTPVPPTPSPTPTPTPAPTPTLSPYELAKQQAPNLAPLADASFEKKQTMKVYTAPSEEGYRENSWQVTTDDEVGIYGIEGDWVLVSYLIGNGSRGRMGYIATSTLNNADTVAQLGLASIELTLTKDADATDDPLNGKGTITTLKKGSNVKLLAFLGSEWAYVETTYKEQRTRLFIPQESLMAE